MARTLLLLFLIGLAGGMPLRALPAAAPPAGPYGGPVRRILINPQDPLTLYAGTLTHGLFQSVDGGASWHRGGTGLPADGQIEALVADPQNPATLYTAVRMAPASGANGDIVYKTVDGGARWRISSAGLPAATITSLAVAPLAAGTLYAATAAGLYRTVDGGASWHSVGAGTVTAVTALLTSDQHPQRLFAGLGRGLARSDDGGVTWTALGTDGPAADAYVDRLVVSPANPSVIFAATDGSGVLRTSDGGASWEAVNTGLTTPYVFDLDVCSSDPHRLYAATADGLFRSTDSAATWTRAVLPGPAAAAEAVACSPTDAAVAYAGAEAGGIYRTSDGGTTWSASNHGLANLAINDLGVVSGGTVVIAATGDGLLRSQDGGLTWQGGSLGGAAATSLSAPAAPQAGGLIYAAVRAGPAVDAGGGVSQPGGVARSSDGGLSWTVTGMAGQHVDLVRASPLDPQRVYAATDDGAVSRSLDGGVSWTDVSGGNGQGSRTVTAMVADPFRTGGLVIGTGDRVGTQIVVSRDGGGTWTPARTDVDAGAAVVSLEADLTHAGVFYAGGNGVYRSVDGGLTWHSAGLQGLGAVHLVATTAALYAASDQLLFRSLDEGATWQQLAVPAGGAGSISALAAQPAGLGPLYVGMTDGVRSVLPPAIPTATPTPVTPTPSAFAPSDLTRLSSLWYVPLAPLVSRDESLTLYNPGTRPVTVSVDGVSAGVRPTARLVVGPGALRPFLPARTWPALQRAAAPVVLGVRAEGLIAVHGQHVLALDRATPPRPDQRWYMVAQGTSPESLWIFNTGTRSGRVRVELRGAKSGTRIVTIVVAAGRSGALALKGAATAGEAVAATVDSLDRQPLLVVRAGAGGMLQVGVSRPATSWYFARGDSPQASGAELVVYAPPAQSATLTLRMCRTGGACLPPQLVRLSPGVVRALPLPSDLIAETLSSTQPVIAGAVLATGGGARWEWQEGATSLAQSWVVVGTLALFNAGSTPARVRVRASPPGRGGVHTFLLGPGARVVIDAAHDAPAGGCTACGMTVDSTLPLVVGQESASVTAALP